MEKIGFHVWSSDLAIGEDGNKLVSSFLRRGCELIEADINSAGGIAGRRMAISYGHVVKGKAGVEQVVGSIRALPDTLITHGHATQESNERFIDALDLSSHLIFSNKEGRAHPNRFNTSRATQKTKSTAIAQVLQDEGRNARVFFIHDGKRVAYLADEFLGDHKGEVKSFDFQGFLKEPEIQPHLAPIMDDVASGDILILDVGLRVFRHIFTHLNDAGKEPLVIKMFGSIEGRFPKIGFPLIEVAQDFAFPYLDFEDLVRRTGIELSNTQKAMVSDSSWRLELPLLVAYAARRAGVAFSSREQFLADMGNALNEIDGQRDIFIGNQLAYAFKDNVNLLKTNYLYQFPQSLQVPDSYPKTLYRKQFLPEEAGTGVVAVNFLYIDILRVTHIDIGDGTWGCDFHLDIVSPHENPIEIINFNNLSSINPKFEVKAIGKENVDGELEKSYRYYVMANFDFLPVADNYPFDLQHVFISYSVADKGEHGMIQPIPEVLLDSTFKVEGWSLREATTGVLRKKEISHRGTKLVKKVDVREEARVGWTLARTNSVTMMKIGIPLFFLLFLNYFTVFGGFEHIKVSVGILTTAFLSGIALYFSTERPQPLRMTTVDLIFLSYYVLTGVTIAVTSISSLINERVFIAAMTILRIMLPVGVVGIGLFLLRRIHSGKLKPRIN